MPIESVGASRIAGIAAVLTLLASYAASAEPARHLAMHEMKPMQPQGQQMPMPQQGGMGSGMKDEMRMRGGMPGMSSGAAQFDPAERIEGLLAFFKVELNITQNQSAAWDVFATALRSSHQHLAEARRQLASPYSRSPQRLEQYERHLAARVDAVKAARDAYMHLYSSLDDSQKHTADDILTPFITAF